MSGILTDASVDLSGARVAVTGITALARDAEAVGVAADDLKELTARLAAPIAALAASMAPHKTGRLSAGIKPSRSKRKVMVRVGSASRLPYAGVNHWGTTGSNGPQWLSKAEERLRARTFAGFGEGIAQLLKRYNW